MPTGSILDDTKKVLGYAPDYTVYDEDLIMHINSVFGTLHQLGVGPVDPFEIFGSDEAWDDFTDGDKALNGVKSLMYLKIRLIFDPPAMSFHVTALETQIKELEWRLTIAAEPIIPLVPILPEAEDG
jgi:hypothetical protein